MRGIPPTQSSGTGLPDRVLDAEFQSFNNSPSCVYAARPNRTLVAYSPLVSGHLELPSDDGEVDVVVLNLHSVTSTQMRLTQSSAIHRLCTQTSGFVCRNVWMLLTSSAKPPSHCPPGHLGFKEQLRGVGAPCSMLISNASAARDSGASRRQLDNFCDRTIGSRNLQHHFDLPLAAIRFGIAGRIGECVVLEPWRTAASMASRRPLVL